LQRRLIDASLPFSLTLVSTTKMHCSRNFVDINITIHPVSTVIPLITVLMLLLTVSMKDMVKFHAEMLSDLQRVPL